MDNFNKKETYVWIDLEMSGLKPESDKILEVAMIITDRRLNIIAESPVWLVHQPDAVLTTMDKWNTKTHSESGLIARSRAATADEAEVQREALRFARRYAEKNSSPMCGNSICQDRRFLARYMPELEAFFHYRNFDVSSFKIVAQARFPKLFDQVKNSKPSSHMALDDTRASIDEMRFYLNNMLRKES